MACYFMYCGLFDSADEALNFFACKRSQNIWGVTGPAQLRFSVSNPFLYIWRRDWTDSALSFRYVNSFERMLKRNALPSKQPILLKSISFHTIPKFVLWPSWSSISNDRMSLTTKSISSISGTRYHQASKAYAPCLKSTTSQRASNSSTLRSDSVKR